MTCLSSIVPDNRRPFIADPRMIGLPLILSGLSDGPQLPLIAGTGKTSSPHCRIGHGHQLFDILPSAALLETGNKTGKFTGAVREGWKRHPSVFQPSRCLPSRYDSPGRRPVLLERIHMDIVSMISRSPLAGGGGGFHGISLSCHISFISVQFSFCIGHSPS